MAGIGFAKASETKLPGQARIQSIDILRGLIMVLMVIDHVRVYSGLPPGGPSPGIFFTRWITHYCAPGFVHTEKLPFIFQLLNQRKYPASQLYLLMTLGPLIALVPWAEKAGGRVSGFFKVIGQVPMFFYLLHIPLIHLTAFVVNVILYGSIHQEWYQSAPFTKMPEEFRWSLPLLYLVFVFDVAILLIACRWYAGYKRSHPEQKWLKYI